MNGDDILQSLYESGIIVNDEDVNLESSLTDELEDEFKELFGEEKTEYNKSIDERFQYLIEGEMKIDEGELEPRHVISSKINDFFIDEDNSESDDSFFDGIKIDIEELKKIHEEDFEKQQFNLDSTVVNIPEEELTEYILVKGVYSSVFKEFIKNEQLVPSGDFPLAIEVNGALIKFKSISPDPKTIYRIKKTLVGYDLTYVNGDEHKPLDTFQFLGHMKFKA